MKPKAKNLIQVNIAVMIWGLTAMFAKGIALPVGDLTCLRSLFCAAALLLFIKIKGKGIRLQTSRDLGMMIVLGLLLGLHWLTYFQALKISSAAVAILALHTYPVLTALVEPICFKEPFRKTDLLLALGAFASIFIMMPEFDLSNRTTQGILLGVLSGLFFMSRNLILRNFVKTYSSSHLMFWQSMVIGIALLPVLFFSGEAPYSSESIYLLILLGVVFTAVPQTLFASGLNHLSAKTVGILASLLPLYGAIFGYLIHSERITARTAIGGCFILGCVALENARQAKYNSA